MYTQSLANPGLIVTVLGLVGGAPGGGRHRASPIHRRRARAASFITNPGRGGAMRANCGAEPKNIALIRVAPSCRSALAWSRRRAGGVLYQDRGEKEPDTNAGCVRGRCCIGSRLSRIRGLYRYFPSSEANFDRLAAALCAAEALQKQAHKSIDADHPRHFLAL